MEKFTKIKIVIMASGQGSTFEALSGAITQEGLRVEVLALISDRPCGATDIANSKGIPVDIVAPKEYSDFKAWDQALLEKVSSFKPDYIFLLGFLRQIGPDLIAAYKGRIYNSHPSLLPELGGKGMYGRYIHSAVIDRGLKKTGVTIHEVTEDYDTGPILKQVEVEVEPEDTPEALESRVKKEEKNLLINFVAQLSGKNRS